MSIPFALIFDRHCLEHTGARTIVGVASWHILQAVVMLFWPSGMGATSTLAVAKFLTVLHLVAGDGRVSTALLMITCALTALIGVALRLDHIRLPLFVPQQVIVFIMMVGGILAAIMSQYLDGTKIPSGHAHIFNDQGVWLLLFGLHWDAMFRRSKDLT